MCVLVAHAVVAHSLGLIKAPGAGGDRWFDVFLEYPDPRKRARGWSPRGVRSESLNKMLRVHARALWGEAVAKRCALHKGLRGGAKPRNREVGRLATHFTRVCALGFRYIFVKPQHFLSGPGCFLSTRCAETS